MLLHLRNANKPDRVSDASVVSATLGLYKLTIAMKMCASVTHRVRYNGACVDSTHVVHTRLDPPLCSLGSRLDISS